jgi:hypothetical protein
VKSSRFAVMFKSHNKDKFRVIKKMKGWDKEARI